jgi:hypothetical protein
MESSFMYAQVIHLLAKITGSQELILKSARIYREAYSAYLESTRYENMRHLKMNAIAYKKKVMPVDPVLW